MNLEAAICLFSKKISQMNHLMILKISIVLIFFLEYLGLRIKEISIAISLWNIWKIYKTRDVHQSDDDHHVYKSGKLSQVYNDWKVYEMIRKTAKRKIILSSLIFFEKRALFLTIFLFQKISNKILHKKDSSIIHNLIGWLRWFHKKGIKPWKMEEQ